MITFQLSTSFIYNMQTKSEQKILSYTAITSIKHEKLVCCAIFGMEDCAVSYNESTCSTIPQTLLLPWV